MTEAEHPAAQRDVVVMHQTTVRFGPDLWEEIEVEAQRAGVSVAQYVRDSALMRVAYTRGRDGDVHYEAALAVVSDGESKSARRERLAEMTHDSVEGATALVSQTAQAVRHSRELRDKARQERGRRRAGDAS